MALNEKSKILRLISLSLRDTKICCNTCNLAIAEDNVINCDDIIAMI